MATGEPTTLRIATRLPRKAMESQHAGGQVQNHWKLHRPLNKNFLLLGFAEVKREKAFEVPLHGSVVEMLLVQLITLLPRRKGP